MGIFSPIVKSKPYGWSDKAPHLSGEDAGLLMEMERQIKESARIESAIQEAARRIASGDREWYGTISINSVHDVQRERMKHAAIAEAFKTLKGRE